MTKTDYEDLDLYRLYLETAESVSDRRAAANTWMLSVNAAVIGFYGYLGEGKSSVDDSARLIWQWAIPAAGILVCLTWISLLNSYQALNSAKFEVLNELEERLPFPLFRKEQDAYKAKKRKGLSKIESWIPSSFIVLYAVIIIAVFKG